MERVDTDLAIGISPALAALAITALLTVYVWTGWCPFGVPAT